MYIACNLFTTAADNAYTGGMGENRLWLDARFPILTQDGADDEEVDGYIRNMCQGAHAGFKYFDCRGIHRITVAAKGICDGAVLQVKTDWDGPVLGEIALQYSCSWMNFSSQSHIPDGVHALYFAYEGPGNCALRSFILE